jgi:hypothetical protein
MIAEVIKYQVGLDVLGFPIIHQHIFINDVEEEISHTKIGKNMRKKKVKFSLITHVIAKNAK